MRERRRPASDLSERQASLRISAEARAAVGHHETATHTAVAVSIYAEPPGCRTAAVPAIFRAGTLRPTMPPSVCVGPRVRRRHPRYHSLVSHCVALGRQHLTSRHVRTQWGVVPSMPWPLGLWPAVPGPMCTAGACAWCGPWW